jgi:uncharacterized protein (DUF697 family)
MAETTAKAGHEGTSTAALTPSDRAGRLARAETLVKDHMLMSAAVGLIPAPVFDIVAGMGIQVALVKRLCDLHKVPFSEKAVRGTVSALLGGVGAGALATGIVASAMKLVPGVGTLFGVAAMPVSLAAVTYAIGQVFIAHFEIGGTLGDFNVSANRPYFKELLQRGKQVAASTTGSSSTGATTKS